jgi:hypothetical protein
MDVSGDQYFKYIIDYNKESSVTLQPNLHMKPPISYPRFSKEVEMRDWFMLDYGYLASPIQIADNDES